MKRFRRYCRHKWKTIIIVSVCILFFFLSGDNRLHFCLCYVWPAFWASPVGQLFFGARLVFLIPFLSVLSLSLCPTFSVFLSVFPICLLSLSFSSGFLCPSLSPSVSPVCQCPSSRPSFSLSPRLRRLRFPVRLPPRLCPSGFLCPSLSRSVFRSPVSSRSSLSIHPSPCLPQPPPPPPTHCIALYPFKKEGKPEVRSVL